MGGRLSRKAVSPVPAWIEPSWTTQQRRQLAAAIEAGETVAYVCTDAWGGPANGGSGTRCEAGAVHSLGAGRTRLCGAAALHGTLTPHLWAGARVWVAIFRDDVCRDESKVGARTRVIVGEVLPGDVIDPSVAVRMGPRAVPHADLAGAYLTRADLAGAYLTRANLAGANLAGANLTRAYLARANLAGANLTRANLAGANLTRANLARADLAGADLTGANCPCPPPAIAPEWEAGADGCLSRKEEK